MGDHVGILSVVLLLFLLNNVSNTTFVSLSAMVKDREILRKKLAFFVPAAVAAAVAATVQGEKHYACKRLGYYDVLIRIL